MYTDWSSVQVVLSVNTAKAGIQLSAKCVFWQQVGTYVEWELDALFDYSYNIYLFLFVKVTVNSGSKIRVLPVCTCNAFLWRHKWCIIDINIVTLRTPQSRVNYITVFAFIKLLYVLFTFYFINQVPVWLILFRRLWFSSIFTESKM
jgi:hypothetical protein